MEQKRNEHLWVGNRRAGERVIYSSLKCPHWNMCNHYPQLAVAHGSGVPEPKSIFKWTYNHYPGPSQAQPFPATSARSQLILWLCWVSLLVWRKLELQAPRVPAAWAAECGRGRAGAAAQGRLGAVVITRNPSTAGELQQFAPASSAFRHNPQSPAKGLPGRCTPGRVSLTPLLRVAPFVLIVLAPSVFDLVSL